MDEKRLENFFKDSKKVPFEELSTVLMVGVARLTENCNLKLENIFNNIPILEIEGFVRGKKKEIKIPDPGPQFSFACLSAKYGDKIRGIVKKLKHLEAKTKKFPNCVIIDVSIPDRVENGIIKNIIINIMIFKSSLKITGAKKFDHFCKACVYIKSVLRVLKDQGVDVWDESPNVVSVETSMENIVFDLGYNIKKDVLRKLAEKEGIISPIEKDAVRILYPTGKEKAKGGERYHNFRVIHTGKVIYSGTKREEMKPFYDNFMNFITKYEEQIRFN